MNSIAKLRIAAGFASTILLTMTAHAAVADWEGTWKGKWGGTVPTIVTIQGGVVTEYIYNGVPQVISRSGVTAVAVEFGGSNFSISMIQVNSLTAATFFERFNDNAHAAATLKKVPAP